MKNEIFKEKEIQIRFFHRIYCFYHMHDVRIAQSIYRFFKNYNDFEEALDNRKIEFTWEF